MLHILWIKCFVMPGFKIIGAFNLSSYILHTYFSSLILAYVRVFLCNTRFVIKNKKHLLIAYNLIKFELWYSWKNINILWNFFSELKPFFFAKPSNLNDKLIVVKYVIWILIGHLFLIFKLHKVFQLKQITNKNYITLLNMLFSLFILKNGFVNIL